MQLHASTGQADYYAVVTDADAAGTDASGTGAAVAIHNQSGYADVTDPAAMSPDGGVAITHYTDGTVSVA